MVEAQPAYEYDLVTIGAGSGGTRASRIAASSYNARVACIEKTFGFVPDDHTGGAGGTCAPCACKSGVSLLVLNALFFQECRIVPYAFCVVGL